MTGQILPKTALIIPVHNAGKDLAVLLKDIAEQSMEFAVKLIMDSSDQKEDAETAREYGWEIFPVSPGTFNHGKTRQLAINKIQERAEIAVFLTQDVEMMESDAIERLVASLCSTARGAAAYGRQMPRITASLAASQAREFLYPAASLTKSYEDRNRLGIRTPFLSDSFAAYNISRLQKIGGFPWTPVNEDMFVGARLLQAGYTIRYEAAARIRHSHDYSLKQEFRRYFDTGVFQSREAWIQRDFGGAGGTGAKLVIWQLRNALRHYNMKGLAEVLAANAAKTAGYFLGRQEKYLPAAICRICSGQPYIFSADKNRMEEEVQSRVNQLPGAKLCSKNKEHMHKK